MVRRWELDEPKTKAGKRKLEREVSDIGARISDSKQYGSKK